MNFTTSGTQLNIDPLSQASIDAAKAVAPGKGLGPAIGDALILKIASGAITHLAQMPAEYQLLGRVCGLPSAR